MCWLQIVNCVYFYKDKFIIAMDVRRDMFKLGSILKKADDERQYFQMYEEIISIIKLLLLLLKANMKFLQSLLQLNGQ